MSAQKTSDKDEAARNDAHNKKMQKIKAARTQPCESQAPSRWNSDLNTNANAKIDSHASAGLRSISRKNGPKSQNM